MVNQKERQALILADTRALATLPKTAHLRAFSAPAPGRLRPMARPGQPRPLWREPWPILTVPGPNTARAGLGPPLDIRQAAELIGCSPWTVRQTLIPRGLPYLRFTANGRLIFYRDQVVRWIEIQQQGGQKTK